MEVLSFAVSSFGSYYFSLFVFILETFSVAQTNMLLDQMTVGFSTSTTPFKTVHTGNEVRCFGICIYEDQCIAFDHDALNGQSPITCKFYSTVDISPSIGDPGITLYKSTGLRDCLEWKNKGFNEDNVYPILINAKIFPVFCRLQNNPWTFIQRRYDGSVSFDRDWRSYREGFGNLRGEHWLGNENIHQITSRGVYQAKFWGKSYNGDKRTVLLQNFHVESETNNYRVSFTPTQDYDINNMNGNSFSTPEDDRDYSDGNNCAANYNCGWWFGSCYNVNLNGMYTSDYTSIEDSMGIVWESWKGALESLEKTEIMIKRVG